MVHRSDEQQHYFNTPFQLSIAPPGAEGSVLSDRWVEPETDMSTLTLAVCVISIEDLCSWSLIGTNKAQ